MVRRANYYKHSHASLCLVLPPVGSTRSAILLLECIEHFIGSALFSNPEIQIQVCSPGRLGARRSRERPPADPTLLIGPTSALETGHKGPCRPSLIRRVATAAGSVWILALPTSCTSI